MLYENYNNKNVKCGKGRPKEDESKQQQQRLPSEFVECCMCWKIYDINDGSYRSLSHAIIDDRNFCPTCWKSEIIEKVYEDQNDIIQQYYGSFGLRRK